MVMADVTQPYVFVTVGTTSFERLVKEVLKSEVMQILKKRGYKKVLVQAGNINLPELNGHKEGVSFEVYNYKESIQKDMEGASLVISHAGAGSIFEALGLKKPLVVVINENLMGNHQIELAERLQKDNHLVFGTCSNLSQILFDLDPRQLQPYELGDPKIFGQFLDSLFVDG